MADLPSAAQVLEREFLPLRGKIIEVAAALDRIARAEGSVEADPRFGQVCRGLELLVRPGPATDRAEQVQLIFSLPYDPAWRGRS